MRRTVLVCLLLALPACATPRAGPAPTRAAVELTAVELLDASFTEMALVAQVTVRNTSPRPQTVAGYEWTLAFDNAAVLTGSRTRAREIPPGEVGRLRIPIAFHFGDLFAQAPALRGRDVLPYRLTLRLGARGRPLEHQGMLTIPQAPVIRLVGVYIRQLNWREATVQLDVTLDPRSASPLELRGLRCALTLDGRPILRAQAESVAVPLQGETLVPLTAHVPLGASGDPTAAILQREDASFHLTGYAMLHTTSLGVLRLPIDEAGVIALTRPGA